jgi:hypothetical protein
MNVDGPSNKSPLRGSFRRPGDLKAGSYRSRQDGRLLELTIRSLDPEFYGCPWCVTLTSLICSFVPAAARSWT